MVISTTLSGHTGESFAHRLPGVPISLSPSPSLPPPDRRTTGTAALLVLSLLVGLIAVFAPGAVAESGEDGAHPDPPGFYESTPLAGWMSERSGDRIHDFAQVGNTVFVAGTFSGVRPSRTGPVTWQGNLAAFDATTGDLITGFDPDVNGTVYSLAVAPDGSRLYAGGSFTTVDGGDHRRLAALDPGTGRPVAGFDADVSGGSVRSVVARGGDLYLGGSFSSVEGVARQRLARLRASDGAVDQAWAPSARDGQVLTLEVPTDGSRVYVGGRFQSIGGRGDTAELAALDPTDGSVDPSFGAQPGREVFDLVATDDGRVYVAEGGYLGRAEAYDTAGDLLSRWETGGDVQAVEQIGDLVYFGGHDFGASEEFEVAAVDPDDLTLFDTEVFQPPTDGGDGVWAFHATGAELWLGGQHTAPSFGFGRYAPTEPPRPRENLVASGSAWSHLDDGRDPGTAWRQPGFDDSAWSVGPAQLGFGDGDETTTIESGHLTYWFRRSFTVAQAAGVTDLRLSLLVDDGAVAYVNGTEVARHNMPGGAIDATTPASTTTWGPAESTFTTFDVPDGLLVDGDNTLAVEVHQVSASSSDVSFDARLSAVGVTPDAEPPSVPAGLRWTDLSDTSFTLLWDPSTDDVAVDHYEIFRDGTSIGTSPTTSLPVTGLDPATAYRMTVEAVDAAGNRSGVSGPVTVTTADPPPPTGELVPLDAAWRYLDDGSDQGTAWRQPGFDDDAWPVGAAELGVGDGDEATVVAGGPVTTWFRRSFSVASAAEVLALDLELRADDGAVVHLNGVEVARDNLPTGPVTATTPASTYRWGSAEQELRSFPLSTAPLVDGINVLAVEVHQAPGSGDLSFAARLESTGGRLDTTPPSVPTGLQATAVGDTTVDLSWAASTDDLGVDHYDLFVDGVAAGSSAGPAATLADLAPSTTYSVEVEAVDGAGNRSGRSAPLPVTTTTPPTVRPLVPTGAVWSFLDDGSDPGPGWTVPGFDDGGWSTGPAELGLGDGDEATVMAPGPVTYHLRHTFPVTGAAAVTELTLDLLADDGAVVYLNGVEVVRDNLPTGPIGPDTPAIGYRWGAAERTFTTFAIPASVLAEGVNTLAVEVHQAPGSTDLSFDLGLTGRQG